MNPRRWRRDIAAACVAPATRAGERGKLADMAPVPPAPAIVVIDRPIDPARLRPLVEAWFGDMVKLVVDVRRALVAVGGELHADAEALLLDRGSQQVDLWGANYYPGLGVECCLEYTALINIRPSHGNRSMEVQDVAVRERIRTIVHELIGTGEPL